MTLKEALTTGLPLRRQKCARHCGSHGTGWVDPDFLFDGCNKGLLNKYDAMADDWEVREPKYTLTIPEIRGLLYKVLNSSPTEVSLFEKYLKDHFACDRT